jgi:endogenous inhibitor of DNA gyrase (YacG/DUF329 family)
MKQQRTRTCPNCGTVLPAESFVESRDSAAFAGYVCPVCQLHVSAGSPRELPRVSAPILERQLLSLVERALASDLKPDLIQAILCDAVTFVAECGHAGHHFSTAVVDLGMTDDALAREPFPDLVEILRQRYVRGDRAREVNGNGG